MIEFSNTLSALNEINRLTHSQMFLLTTLEN